MAEKRVRGEMDREQPSGIGAQSEEGRLAQCQDPGITERQVERHREENPDYDLGPEVEIRRRGEEIDDSDRPGQ
jgi:hypothetical protein